MFGLLLRAWRWLGRPVTLAVAVCLAVAGPRLLRASHDQQGPAGPAPRLGFSGPFLEKVGDSIRLVRVTREGVPAREFLLASYGIITIFDSLPGMGVVKSDMLGNADALWRHMRPGRTMEQLCDSELEALGGVDDQAAKHRAARTGGSACTSLLWLKRALKFVEAILSAMLKSLRAPLKECVNSAYAVTLRKHHGLLVKGVFAAAVNAAPPRAVFVANLAPAGASETAAMRMLGQLLPELRRPLEALDKYFSAHGIEA